MFVFLYKWLKKDRFYSPLSLPAVLFRAERR
eukprot:COSAG06_NODE_61758_length_267_cov_0.077381_1_plen_30_part_10